MPSAALSATELCLVGGAEIGTLCVERSASADVANPSSPPASAAAHIGHRPCASGASGARHRGGGGGAPRRGVATSWREGFQSGKSG